MRFVLILVSALVSSVSLASAQAPLTPATLLQEFVASVGPEAEQVCAKVRTPALCRMDFGRVVLTARHAMIVHDEAVFAGVNNDGAGYATAKTKVMAALEMLPQELEKLIGKYEKLPINQ